MTPQTSKAARAGLNLTQGALAKAARVHRRTVCNFERGASEQSPQVKAKLERAFAAQGVVFTDQGVIFSNSV